MRDIKKVIDRVLELIPKSHTKLRERLRRQQEGARYMAPEVRGQLWKEVGWTLDEGLCHLTKVGWVLRVHQIWTDTETAADAEADAECEKRDALALLLMDQGWSAQVAVDCALFNHPYSKE